MTPHSRPPLCPDAVFYVPHPCLGDEEPQGPKLYFFKNQQFMSWDVMSEEMCPGFPRDIESHFPGLMKAGHGERLRGALRVPAWGSEVLFLFGQGRRAVAWDLEGGGLLPGEIELSERLPGLFEQGPVTPIYAETAQGEPVVYAFNGMEYMRWKIEGTGQASLDSGFPRKTAHDWKDGLVLAPQCGVYLEWSNRSNAHSNRKIYCFMGDLYLRWDVPSHTRNYRLDIVAGWKGWPEFK